MTGQPLPPLPPIVLAVAPTGSRRTKKDHPALPTTPEDLADAAAQCQEVGASMVHMHVRDRDGRHVLQPEAYHAAIRAVRAVVGDDMIIQVTAEAGGRYPPAEQIAAVRAVRPEAVALPLDEMLPDDSGLPAYAALLADLDRAGVLVQHQLCSPAEAARFCELRRRGAVPERATALFLLGGPGSDAAPRDLIAYLAAWSDTMPWMTGAFGPRENACVMAGAAFGGHARVGFETNVCLCGGRPAADNAALVAQLAKGVGLVGRSVADVATARRILAGGVP